MNDQARRRNGNLAGMGGVFNYVNLHVYHYGGNNPIKYVDPDGRADDRIHRGDRDRGVYRWAREAGFNEARSARIANANNSVDYGSTGYLPGEDPSRHFNTNIVDSGTPIDSRIGNAQSNLKESIRLKNLAMSLGEDSASFTSIMNHSLDLLGIAGHLLIDVAFHTDSVVGVIAGVHFHFPGFDIDNPDARPDSVNCAEWMIKGTFEMWDKGVYDPNHEIWNPSLNWDGFDGL
ncbi:MAG: hypothetical protein LBU88_07695 [Treponema sp.]|nr:hypothetical protein [Treponema sp.]